MPKVFVAMPNDKEAQRIWLNVVSVACLRSNVKAIRARDQLDRNCVWPIILDKIQDSLALLALASKQNSNVSLEIGYALGAGKPVVIIGKEKDEELFSKISTFINIYQCEDTLRDRIYSELTRLKNDS